MVSGRTHGHGCALLDWSPGLHAVSALPQRLREQPRSPLSSLREQPALVS